MGRSDKSDKIQAEFLQLLENSEVKISNLKELSSHVENDLLKSIFISWSKANRNIYYVKDVGFVNVHVRSESKGFWGIPQSIQKDFNALENELGISCWYVLLLGREDKWLADGYIIDHSLTKPILNLPTPSKGHYKINEKSNLDTSCLIQSLETVAETLVAKGKDTMKNKEKNT